MDNLVYEFLYDDAGSANDLNMVRIRTRGKTWLLNIITSKTGMLALFNLLKRSL